MLKRICLPATLILIALFSFAYGQPQDQQPPRQERGENTQADKDNSGAGEKHPPILEVECNSTCTAKNAEKDGNDGHITRLVNKTIDDPITILTGLLAIATFALVWVVLCQLRDARNFSKQQLRAYVFATITKFNIKIGNPSEIIISYETKNWGQTPAYHIRNASFIRKMPWPLPRGFIVESPILEDPRHVTLAPGQGMFQDASETYETLPANQRYYIVGLIEYFHAFSRRNRTTKFCFSVDANTFIKTATGRAGGDDVPFDVAPQHNEAD